MKKKRQSRRILGQSACRRACAGSEKSRGKSRERKVSEKRKNLIWLIMFAGVFLLALFVRAYRIGITNLTLCILSISEEGRTRSMVISAGFLSSLDDHHQYL